MKCERKRIREFMYVGSKSKAKIYVERIEKKDL